MHYLRFLPYAIPLLFFSIVFYLWYKNGRDEKSVEVIEFEPPENLGPLEVGYVYKQLLGNSDVATLLISLANKGYLQIEEIKKNFFQKDFCIHKLKDYDGENVNEELFFKALFRRKKNLTSKDLTSYTEKNYKNSTAKALNSAVEAIKNDIEKTFNEALFEKNSLYYKTITAVLMVVSWVLTVCALIFTHDFGEEAAILIIFLTAFPIVGYATLSYGLQNFRKNNYDGQFFTLFGTIWCSITTLVLGMFLLELMPFYEIGPIILFNLACIIGMDILRALMPKWTIQGNALYGRVLGFRRFLKKVEVEKLQTLVNENPKYFYNLIPYAYVLGLEKAWFEKYAKITCPPPEYYSGTTYGAGYYGRTISRAISKIGQASTPPSSSSGGHGGFGGGGGCGGGGCGGGGGGGW